jgi:hypothetical protein
MFIAPRRGIVCGKDDTITVPNVMEIVQTIEKENKELRCTVWEERMRNDEHVEYLRIQQEA